MVRPTTVSVVDTDRMLLEGLAVWFASRPDLRLVRACASVDELFCSEPDPADVVLIDIEPFENVRRMAAAGCRVLVMGSARYADRLVESMSVGAKGYLTKDHDLAALAGAIHRVATGNSAYVRAMLAPREQELLLAYVSGMTMTAAARRIGVRPSTARTYLERIKKKYAGAGRPAYTKLELAARVREDGLWI